MKPLVDALKDEIRRLARKEIKSQTTAANQAITKFRREIAQLKRDLAETQKKLTFLERQERKRIAEPDAAPSEEGDVRFSARSVKAQRRRTGLSAADYGKLVGVSQLTVYNWENGKSRPRKAQMDALVALRGMGKREALAKLALVDGAAKGPKRRGRPPKTK